MKKTIIALLVIFAAFSPLKGHGPGQGKGLFSRPKKLFANILVVILPYYFEQNPCFARDMVIDTKDSKTIFINSCSGCHNNGGNLLNPAKTLKKDDLLKFEVFERSKLSALISQGRGQMPAYGEFISPKGNLMPAKLTPTEIDNLSDYIIDMAEKSWPASEISKNCDEYPGC